MKQIIVLLIAIVCGFSSFAQDENRLVISAGQIRNLSIGDNMNVTLVNAGSAQKEIKGDMKFFEKISVSVSEGAMHIELRRNLAQNDKVYIIVDELQELSVGENTEVFASGELQTKEIKVFIGRGSTARLRTKAKVNAYSTDGSDVFLNYLPVPVTATAKSF